MKVSRSTDPAIRHSHALRCLRVCEIDDTEEMPSQYLAEFPDIHQRYIALRRKQSGDAMETTARFTRRAPRGGLAGALCSDAEYETR